MDLKPVIFMITYQLVLTGVNMFYKLANSRGMKVPVLIAYRFLFASSFTVPAALVVDRNVRPVLTWKIAFQAFFTGLLGGSMAQNIYGQGLIMTSATFASALINLVPTMTFALSVIFRMEKAALGTISGKAKLTGAFICLAGATIFTFYKGREIALWFTDLNILHGGQQSHGHHGSHVLGVCLVIGSSVSFAFGFIIQAKLIENYPYNYSSTALTNVLATIQAFIFALCMEKRDWSTWKLGWNLRLLTVIYVGVVASGVMSTVLAFCMQTRGPVFVCIFNPLNLVLVAIAGSLLLDEKLHMGSLIGSIVIFIGLYLYLWGKSKELKMAQLASRKSDSVEVIIDTSASDENCSSIHGVGEEMTKEEYSKLQV